MLYFKGATCFGYRYWQTASDIDGFTELLNLVQYLDITFQSIQMYWPEGVGGGGPFLSLASSIKILKARREEVRQTREQPAAEILNFWKSCRGNCVHNNDTVICSAKTKS